MSSMETMPGVAGLGYGDACDVFSFIRFWIKRRLSSRRAVMRRPS
jgi:hypothetical protein